jgi:oxygen-dependent protoporphyrinogen oxidase
LSAAVVGIFAGDCNRLSAKSCFRFFWEIDKDSWSFLVGGIKRRLNSRMNTRKWKGMVSFRGGLGSFCEALAHPLADRIHLNTAVERIERNGPIFKVTAKTVAGDAVQFSTPNLILGMDLTGAISFLETLAPETAEELKPIESASLAVVNLGFSSEAFVAPPVGFGFLVPEREKGVKILGTLFASSVFPHQAPEGCHSLRVFVGGYRNPELLTLSDAELSQHAVAELSKLVELKEPPLLVQVSRYPQSIPQMVSGHSERIERVEQKLKKYPGLHLVGNYLHGVSVNDCICHARRTAQKLLVDAG